jgi:hypothetical protein
LDPRATFSIHLTLLISRSIQLSKNSRVLHASRAIYYATYDPVNRGQKLFLIRCSLESVAGQPHRPLGWIKRSSLYQSGIVESSLAFKIRITQSVHKI